MRRVQRGEEGTEKVRWGGYRGGGVRRYRGGGVRRVQRRWGEEGTEEVG